MIPSYVPVVAVVMWIIFPKIVVRPDATTAINLVTVMIIARKSLCAELVFQRIMMFATVP